MRVIVRAVIGAAVAGGLFAISITCRGCLAAGALLLAYFVAVAGLGFTVAAYVDYREDRTLRGGPTRQFTGHCHECGRHMLQTGAVWICPICDRAPAHFFVGRRRRAH